MKPQSFKHLLRRHGVCRVHGMRMVLWLFLSATLASAKSIVFTLNDKVGTRVYVRIDGDEPPKLVMNGDGSFTLNGIQYEFANVKCFAYSKTDYAGEKNTVDAVEQVTSAPQMCLQGNVITLGAVRSLVCVLSLDGKVVRTLHQVSSVSMDDLAPGTYVITDGVSTLKIQRR